MLISNNSRSAARSGRTLTHFAIFAWLIAVLWFAAPFDAAALPPPVITAVNPVPLVLAGTQVAVNGNGFVPSAPVTFQWDGVASAETPSADATGALAGQPLTVPLSLQPGMHQLIACSPAASCSTPFGVHVGPVSSTSVAQPVARGQTIAVTVAGLQAGSIAIFGWNGVFAAAPTTLVPDAASFTVSATVPLHAPAHSVFEVCERTSGTTCMTTVATRGTLSITVVIPPPPPTATPAPTTAAAVPVTSSSAPAVIAQPTSLPTTRSTPRPTTHAPSKAPPSSTASPTPSPTASAAPTAKPVAAPVDPKPAAIFTPTTVVHFEVVGFTILTLVGGRGIVLGIVGLPVPGSPDAAADAAGAAVGRRPRGKATSAKVKNFKGISAGVSGGDNSRTWRWPGTTRLDAATLQLPVRTARFSPCCPVC